ncbi:MAG: hypothetical protein QM784_08805 [Polyangiaceae bacterium]
MKLDTNDDGEIDKKLDYPRYDVLLTHRRSDAEIWLSTLPLSGKNGEKDLHVLLERFVEGISGTGSVVVVNLSETQKVAVGDKRYATRVVEQRSVLVDGVEGLEALIEVANVDQLQLSPESRWARSKVVLLRPGFKYTLGADATGTAKHSWPVLVMAGYTNSAEGFPENLGDFDRFLGQIDFLSDDEVVARNASDILNCSGTQSFDIELKLDGTGAISKLPKNLSICMRRLVSRLRFTATGMPRTYRTSVTANSSQSLSSKGYQVVANIPSANATPSPTSPDATPSPTNSAATPPRDASAASPAAASATPAPVTSTVPAASTPSSPAPTTQGAAPASGGKQRTQSSSTGRWPGRGSGICPQDDAEMAHVDFTRRCHLSVTFQSLEITSTESTTCDSLQRRLL